MQQRFYQVKIKFMMGLFFFFIALQQAIFKDYISSLHLKKVLKIYFLDGVYAFLVQKTTNWPQKYKIQTISCQVWDMYRHWDGIQAGRNLIKMTNF